MGPVERRQIAKSLICMDSEEQASSNRLPFGSPDHQTLGHHRNLLGQGSKSSLQIGT